MSEFNFLDQPTTLLGEDLSLQEGLDGGDFAVTSGDLSSISQTNNLREAIKRRIFTPAGSIGTFIQDANGMYDIDSTYGNSAYRYLSEPLTNETLANMRDAIVECLKQEPRIVIIDVIPSIRSLPDGSSTIDFIAEYRIIDTQSTDNLVITYDPSNSRLF